MKNLSNQERGGPRPGCDSVRNDSESKKKKHQWLIQKIKDKRAFELEISNRNSNLDSTRKLYSGKQIKK